jgi:hypothetical protein
MCYITIAQELQLSYKITINCIYREHQTDSFYSPHNELPT